MGTYYVKHEAPEPVRPGQLWFGVGASTVAWASHLVICYALASLDCYWSLFPFIIFGISGIRIVLLVLTILAVAVVIASGIVSYGNWRGLEYSERGRERDPTGRFRFMMLSGVLLSGLYMIGLIWSLFVIFLTQRCL